MTAERRLRAVEASLSPAQLDTDAPEPPLNRLYQEVLNGAQSGLRSERPEVVDKAIRSALRETVFRFDLVMRILVTTHDLLEREGLIDAALFPDAVKAWDAQLKSTEAIADVACRLAELDGVPPAEPPDPGAVSARVTELVADLVEPAKTTALERLDEGRQALTIATAWLRPKLLPKSIEAGGVGRPDTSPRIMLQSKARGREPSALSATARRSQHRSVVKSGDPPVDEQDGRPRKESMAHPWPLFPGFRSCWAQEALGSADLSTDEAQKWVRGAHQHRYYGYAHIVLTR